MFSYISSYLFQLVWYPKKNNIKNIKDGYVITDHNKNCLNNYNHIQKNYLGDKIQNKNENKLNYISSQNKTHKLIDEMMLKSIDNITKNK